MPPIVLIVADVGEGDGAGAGAGVNAAADPDGDTVNDGWRGRVACVMPVPVLHVPPFAKS